jgi:hypothetical protein
MRIISRKSGLLVLEITQDHKSNSYAVASFGTGEEAGVAWTKLGTGEVHHCHVGTRTCDCKGFTRWNHCKHQSATVALTARGELS